MTRVLGVDLGGTNTKIVLLDEAGQVLRRENFATGRDADSSVFSRQLVEQIQPYLKDEDAPIAVGVGMAGLLNLAGVVEQAPNLPYLEGWHITEDLSEKLSGLAVICDNDVNTAAYAELHLGAAKGARNVIMLALGTGVGGAIIIDGELYRGTRGMGAELGHMILQVDGPDCACGQPGHVESYLSTRAIVIHAGGRLDAASDAEKQPLLEQCREEGELSPRALALAAAKGDPLSESILGDVGRLLGVVCASYVNIFNPEVVVIGGGVAGAGMHLLGPARKSMKERAMASTQQGVRMVLAELGHEAAAIGAGLLALHALAED